MTIGWVEEVFSRRRGKPAAAEGPANGHLTSSSSSIANAQLLRAMDATTRCIISLGRPSGCGMPGSVAAAPLAQLLGAATAHMQQCLLQQQQQQHTWSFVDIGAGAGRMLLAAKLFGASNCAGIELCDLTHTFEACKARCIKKGLLQPAAAHSCRLHVGDASTLSTASSLLGPEAAPAESADVMVSLIDEGMPLSVREHAYSCVAQDPRVLVVVTVNYRSRAAHLPAVLTGAGFQLAQEMPAPLMGGKCSTAGRIFVRTQQPPQPQQRRVLPKQEQQQQQVQQQRRVPKQPLRQQAEFRQSVGQQGHSGTSSVEDQQPTRRSQRVVRPPAGRS